MYLTVHFTGCFSSKILAVSETFRCASDTRSRCADAETRNREIFRRLSFSASVVRLFREFRFRTSVSTAFTASAASWLNTGTGWDDLDGFFSITTAHSSAPVSLSSGSLEVWGMKIGFFIGNKHRTYIRVFAQQMGLLGFFRKDLLSHRPPW